jgi:hypothetical protein
MPSGARDYEKTRAHVRRGNEDPGGVTTMSILYCFGFRHTLVEIELGSATEAVDVSITIRAGPQP